MTERKLVTSIFFKLCDGLLRLFFKQGAGSIGRSPAWTDSSTHRVSLARASLVYDWRRYLAAVLALTFAGLLLVVQMALLLGMFGTVSAVVEQSKGDLWVGFRNTPSVDLGRPLHRFADSGAWRHPDVLRVEPYLTAYGDLRRADGAPLSVLINGFDPRREGLVYARLLTPDQRALLAEPDTILIDIADRPKLRAEVGESVEINGRRVRLAGVVDGVRAIGGVNVLASLTTARRLAPENTQQPSFILVALRDGANAEAVQSAIADPVRFPRHQVWQASELAWRSQSYWLFETGAGTGTAFASLLALIVGMVITSQTLSAAILASVKEFAALRALGVTRGNLRRVVIEQALWIGIVGLLFAGALTFLLAGLGDLIRVDMRFPAWMLSGVAGSMLFIAVVSGLLALRPLDAADPASLLR
ncbi:MAG: ABC transporter permease [Dechloromonas sp.]|nr:ABC transporter permease [Dechloromonas sp.]